MVVSDGRTMHFTVSDFAAAFLPLPHPFPANWLPASTPLRFSQTDLQICRQNLKNAELHDGNEYRAVPITRNNGGSSTFG